MEHPRGEARTEGPRHIGPVVAQGVIVDHPQPLGLLDLAVGSMPSDKFMDAVSFSHVVVMAFIVVANVAYFAGRKKEGAR